MTGRTIIIWLVGALFALLLLGVLAGQFGGIAVRNNVTRTDTLELQLSQPVVRGVETTVRWNGDGQAVGQEVGVYFRDELGEHILATVDVSSGVARAVFDCGSSAETASVILRNMETAAVLAAETVTLLPPGRECAF